MTDWTSPLRGNPYVTPPDMPLSAEQAKYQAIMALAYERRTANMIAYAREKTLPAGADVMIRDRMGLD